MNQAILHAITLALLALTALGGMVTCLLLTAGG